jgi:hypothetical protein
MFGFVLFKIGGRFGFVDQSTKGADDDPVVCCGTTLEASGGANPAVAGGACIMLKLGPPEPGWPEL